MQDRENKSGKVKTRDIPFLDYFSRKQLEYISYKVRFLIYNEREEDQIKFREVCDKIKRTIDDMSFKNMKKSIFTSSAMLEKYCGEFFNEVGLPNFQYRDEYQERVKGFWDAHYWWKPGTEIELENGTRCIIKKHNTKTCELIAVHKDDPEVFVKIHSEGVKRIIDFDIL